nr:tocopherol cyclase family protein [uncultured Sellimonas sp.]
MKQYFYGWYMRCQSEEGTVAVIPSVHLSEEKQTCSIQVITEQGVWKKEYPVDEFYIDRKKMAMKIGKNIFSKKGMRLHLHEKDWEIKGNLRFGEFKRLKYPIMGPFHFLKGMECKHDIYSMKHLVNGRIRINGKELAFQNGKGYMEGDRGNSFPEKYTWTQHFFDENSIVLAVASVPIGKIRFTGIIAALLWEGKEHRFATYLGARVKREENEICIKQGKYRLRVKILEMPQYFLDAPQNGQMTRKAGETVAGAVWYSLSYKGKELFEVMTEQAAFETEVESNKTEKASYVDKKRNQKHGFFIFSENNRNHSKHQKRKRLLQSDCRSKNQ